MERGVCLICHEHDGVVEHEGQRHPLSNAKQRQEREHDIYKEKYDIHVY